MRRGQHVGVGKFPPVPKSSYEVGAFSYKQNDEKPAGYSESGVLTQMISATLLPESQTP
jgi:hypothetical protein